MKNPLISITIALLFLLSPLKSVFAQETVFTDTFTRSVGSGWSTNQSQTYGYTGLQSGFSVNGSAGLITVPAGGNYSAQITTLQYTDVEMFYKVRFSQAATGGTPDGYVSSPFLRYVDGANNYRIEFRFRDNGSVAIGATKEVTDILTSLGTQELGGITFSANTDYFIRARVTGTNPTTLQANIWPDGMSEPSSWQFERTDSEAILQAPGGFGVRTRIPSQSTNAPVTSTIDDLTIISYDSPPASPTPSPTTAPTATPEPTDIPQFSVFYDFFDRIVTNAWGNSSSDTSYTGLVSPLSDYQVDGDDGLITASSATNKEIFANFTPSVPQYIRARLKVDKTSTGASADGYVPTLYLRYPNASNNYRLEVRFRTSTASPPNSIQIQFVKEFNNAVGSFGSAVVIPGITYAPDTYYNVKAEITGTGPVTLSAKVWAEGLEEPTSYQLITTDTTNVIADAGIAGLRLRLPSDASNFPITMSVDTFQVSAGDFNEIIPSSNGTPTPTPSVAPTVAPTSGPTPTPNLSGSAGESTLGNIYQASGVNGQTMTGSNQIRLYGIWRARDSGSLVTGMADMQGGSGNQTARLVVYELNVVGNAYAPGTLVEVSDPVVISANQPRGWVEFTFPSENTITRDTRYALGVWFEGTGGAQLWTEDRLGGRWDINVSGSAPATVSLSTDTARNEDLPGLYVNVDVDALAQPSAGITRYYPEEIPTTTPVTNPMAGAHRWRNLTTVPGLNESIAYQRYTWDQVEGATEGSYNWTVITNDINAALSRGQMFAFRVRSRVNSYDTPAYLDGLTFNSVYFRQRHRALHEAMKAQFDGNPNIAWIDMDGPGDYGEWRNGDWNDITQDAKNDVASYLADVWENADTPTVMFTVGATELRLLRQTHSTVGFRNDIWGGEGAAAHMWSQQAVTERMDIINSGERGYPLLGEIDSAISKWSARTFLIHTTFFGPHTVGNGNFKAQSENFSLYSAQDQTEIREAYVKMGYRLLVHAVDIPEQITLDTPAAITFHWHNRNVNVPVGKDRGTAYLRLVNESDQVVATYPLNVDVTELRPSALQPHTLSESITVSGLAPGTYTAQVRVVQESNRSMNLANTGRTADGAYPLGTITVVSASAPTSTPAPTATDIPVPTATNTPVPVPTDTPVPGPTNTLVPPATPTDPPLQPTAQPTATLTPGIPTATPTNSPLSDVINTVPVISGFQNRSTVLPYGIARNYTTDELSFLIRKRSGPGNIQVSSLNNSGVGLLFDQVGSYEVELETSDGVDQLIRTVNVTINPESSIPAPISNTEPVNLYGFYNTKNRTFFYTTSIQERNIIQEELTDTYLYIDSVLRVSNSPGNGLYPVYRFYNPRKRYHLFTISEAEKNAILENRKEYVLEGISFYAPLPNSPGSSRCSYRFYIHRAGIHIITTDLQEARKYENERGTTFEGNAWACIPLEE